jgi:hypothetical protein
MKVRLLAVMALVVVGAMAGTSPAMAANKKAKTSVSKAWQNQHKDNKVFGDAINNLRRGSDQTNYTIQAITEQSVAALTALKDGLTAVGDSYTNFEYGVVQLYAGNDAIPGAFAATPRIDPTVEQSTVTAQFPCLPTAAEGVCDLGDIINAKATVRSANILANNKASDVSCRAQISQGNTNNWVASLNGATPFIEMVRSSLTPPSTSAEPTFPAAMVSSDSLTSLTAAGKSVNQNAATGGTGGFAITTGITPAAGPQAGMLEVTLSCLSVPQS